MRKNRKFRKFKKPIVTFKKEDIISEYVAESIPVGNKNNIQNKEKNKRLFLFELESKIKHIFNQLKLFLLQKAKAVKNLINARNVSRMDYYKNNLNTLKKWRRIFCSQMTCRTNLKRDIFIIVIFIVLLTLILLANNILFVKKDNIKNIKDEIVNQIELGDKIEEINVGNIQTIQEKIDTKEWGQHQSNWYGFKIKYPENWKNPHASTFIKNSRADYRVSFLVNTPESKDFIGFEVAVYDINKVKELSATDEFPKLKNEQPGEYNQCKIVTENMIETGNYPAEEIYIPLENECYESTLFFSVVDGQYIYNIVPLLKNGVFLDSDPLLAVSDNLPEFFAAVSQFENIDIIRPKSKPVQKKITAPKPVAYKIFNGKMVCDKKNDKPSKSDKNKKKHLDMECCLDPDEYPNPHCHYDSVKYGKYLK
jgi:hypothetical protein